MAAQDTVPYGMGLPIYDCSLRRYTMTFLKHTIKFAAMGLAAATIATGLGTALPQPTLAQGGLTIFGGVDPDFRLNYFIDFNTPFSRNARYYLNINRTKLPREVISLEIDYPEAFTEMRGRLDPNAIELRRGTWRGDGNIPLKAVDLIEDEGRIEIIPEEPIPANTNLVVVMSNVQNPRRYGYHYFNLRMMFQGDVMNQYVGTWPLEVASDSNRRR
ncbi:MAG: DUF2808 domain-containing protein [Leptolyngbya sp. LCM1.Bin17]|nr:MAG: DUF2808 domain-containing protein [Leptolyngbya sp. LCM1.Bin17]